MCGVGPSTATRPCRAPGLSRWVCSQHSPLSLEHISGCQKGLSLCLPMAPLGWRSSQLQARERTMYPAPHHLPILVFQPPLDAQYL